MISPERLAAVDKNDAAREVVHSVDWLLRQYESAAVRLAEANRLVGALLKASSDRSDDPERVYGAAFNALASSHSGGFNPPAAASDG